MKEGFYLSPDGKKIVELKQHRSYFFIDVIGLSVKWVDALFDIDKQDAKIIFSCWIYLGRV
jgi:hypothetical protein